jgi:mono/diheme cytochrome c family protein
MKATEGRIEMGRVLLGVLLVLVLAPVLVLGWLKWGNVPVAVADAPFPYERQLVGMPLHARIAREPVKNLPIQTDEDSLVAGARVYNEKCAVCHGLHGKPSELGAHLYPFAPALWEKHGNAVGVSNDPPSETMWKVTNGIRLTGMPSYKGILTDNEIWEVSMLLSNADKDLPPVAVDILRGNPAVAAEPVVVKEEKKK